MLRIDKRTTQGWLDVEDVNFLQLGRKLWIQFPDGLLQLGAKLGQVVLMVHGPFPQSPGRPVESPSHEDVVHPFSFREDVVDPFGFRLQRRISVGLGPE